MKLQKINQIEQIVLFIVKDQQLSTWIAIEVIIAVKKVVNGKNKRQFLFPKLRNNCTNNQVKQEGNPMKQLNFDIEQAIQQSSEELEVITVYQSERKPKKRSLLTISTIQRIKVLFQQKLTNTTINFHKIASALSLGYSTVSQLHRQWLIDSSLSNRLMKLKRQNQKKGMLNIKRSAVLRGILLKNPFLTQEEIKDKMNSDPCLTVYNKPISRYVVYCLLKQNKFIRKKALQTGIAKNNKAICNIRRQYCQWLQEKAKDPSNNIYYLGSVELNLYNCRGSGWSKQGEDISLACTTSQGQNICLLLGLGIEGLIYYKIIDGSIDKQSYLQCLQSVLDKTTKLNPHKHVFLIQTSSPIYNQNCRQISSKYPTSRVIFLPPYSPQLNPTQKYFQTLRATLKHSSIQTFHQFKRQLQTFLEHESKKPLDKYYQSVFYYVKKGIKGQNF